MAEQILMPKLSPTMEEGQISSWLKKEGDPIEENEAIAEVDTDKATMEMTSLTGGTLLKIIVQAGENARLGQPIGIIGEKGEDIAALLADADPSANGAGATPGEGAEDVPAPQQTPDVSGQPESTVLLPKDLKDGVRLLVSPIAARMASENGIDLRIVSGSGPNGRIIKRDIEKALEAGASAASATPSFAYGKTSEVPGASAYREENTSPMRRVIARRLGESIGPVPTFYLTVEMEMDGTLALRKRINSAIAPKKISVNDIIIKASAAALMRHPFVNASYGDDKIRFYEDADIGVAVAVDEGLITPVIRSANKKGFVEIAGEVRELAARAREKKLQPEEYQGATFSISNLGMFGIKEFTALINPPEAAILAIGRAEPVPVVRDGEIVVRSIMHITMSCDHRVVDGATGARFLQALRQMLEDPAMMLA